MTDLRRALRALWPRDDPAAGAWREPARVGRAGLLALVAVPLLWVLATVVPNVWGRMALYYAVLLPLALAGEAGRWRMLLVPRPGQVALGAGAAALLYALGWAGFQGLIAMLPSLAAEMPALYTWRDTLPHPLAGLVLLPAIVAGEEIVWRGAITLPLAGRWGPGAGVLLGAGAFGAAHVGFGSVLLVLAAVGCGIYWAALAVWTRSLVPGFVCHLLWDAAVLFWAPY